MSEWISVKDKLPEEGQKVLCYEPDVFPDERYRSDYDVAVYENGRWETSNYLGAYKPTHWMPLPPPPLT